MSLANLSKLALGHIDMEMVTMRLIGLGPKRRAKDPAGAIVGGVQEFIHPHNAAFAAIWTPEFIGRKCER